MSCCCVPLCKSNQEDKTLSFHEFPADSQLKEQWLKNIPKVGFAPNDTYRPSLVCCKHFKDDDYVKDSKPRKLKEGAMPTVFPKYSIYIFSSSEKFINFAKRKCLSIDEETFAKKYKVSSSSNVIKDQVRNNINANVINQLKDKNVSSMTCEERKNSGVQVQNSQRQSDKVGKSKCTTVLNIEQMRKSVQHTEAMMKYKSTCLEKEIKKLDELVASKIEQTNSLSKRLSDLRKTIDLLQ